MPKFNSLKGIANFIQDQLNEITKEELVPKVKEVQIDKIQKVVYNAYNPKQYIRRYGNQGLRDISNIKSRPIDNGKYYKITNETRKKGSNGYLAPIIEYGDRYSRELGYGGYDYPLDGSFRPYMKPRPFIRETVKEFEDNDLHYKIMKDALTRKGFSTK